MIVESGVVFALVSELMKVRLVFMTRLTVRGDGVGVRIRNLWDVADDEADDIGITFLELFQNDKLSENKRELTKDKIRS
jgi:hypothetical protein